MHFSSLSTSPSTPSPFFSRPVLNLSSLFSLESLSFYPTHSSSPITLPKTSCRILCPSCCPCLLHADGWAPRWQESGFPPSSSYFSKGPHPTLLNLVNYFSVFHSTNMSILMVVLCHIQLGFLITKPSAWYTVFHLRFVEWVAIFLKLCI